MEEGASVPMMEEEVWAEEGTEEAVKAVVVEEVATEGAVTEVVATAAVAEAVAEKVVAAPEVVVLAEVKVQLWPPTARSPARC